jgi:hypothetical protein
MPGLSPVLVALSLAAGADVQTLTGKKLAGDLAGLDKQTVVLKTTDGEVRHPVADVLQIDLPATEQPAKGGYYDVELTDGTVLHCAQVLLKGKKAELTVLGDLHVTVPLTAVFTVLRDAHDPQVKAEFQQFLTQRGRYDSVVVRSEGRLNGLDGTFGDGTAAGDGIDFTVKDGGQKVVPKLAKVVGFVFEQRPDPAAPPVLCKVSDAARNLLVAADVTLNDRGLAVTTVAGARVTYPDAGRLTRLDFSKGKLTYLSDLEPTAVVETSTEDHVFHFRRDANLDGGPLRMGGEAYAKGLGVHSRTVLTYDIGGEYREFRAVLGVDEGVVTDARVMVVIEGDGRELYKAEVGRKDPPRPVALDVKGVRQLRVVVQSAGLLDLGAQVNLGEARVSK